MNTTTTPALQTHFKSGESFTKLRSLKDVKADLKEARRVGYIVQTEDDYGKLFSFSINCNESGDLVMSGLGFVSGDKYVTSISKSFFVE